MAATELNLTTEQGADYGPLTFQWCEDGPVVNGVITAGAPIDITGAWTARLQVRTKRDSTKGALLLTATSLAGDIDLLENPTQGYITVLIPGAKTMGIDVTKAYYDLKLYSPGGKEYFVLFGTMTNRLAVTLDS